MIHAESTNEELGADTQAQQAIPPDSFDVLVIAPMSAGKSTLINALLGRELLHSANEATTACLTSINYRENERFFNGACYSQNGQEISAYDQVSYEQVRLWNADPQVSHIKLFGDFFGSPSPIRGLVLHDTPGPNNSRDERHALIMQEALDRIRSHMVIYVLNTEQLGINDDRSLLVLLRKKMAEKPMGQIVFVLNKIDLLDLERGERVEDCVRKTQEYLEWLGFIDPVIIPVASSAALFARKVLNGESLTSMQRIKLNQMLDGFHDEKYTLIRSATVPEGIKSSVRDEICRLENVSNRKLLDPHTRRTVQLRQLVAYSGIRTLESASYHQYKESMSDESDRDHP